MSNTRKTTKPATTDASPVTSREEITRQARESLDRRDDLHTAHELAVESIDTREEEQAETLDEIARDAIDDPETAYLRADAAVKVARLRADHLKAAAARADREVVNGDLSLADLVAEVMTDLLDGHAPVYVTSLTRDLANVNADAAVVVQETPSVARGGLLSGEVTIHLIRRPLLAPLDAERVLRACRNLGWDATTKGVRSSNVGEERRDSLTLTIAKASATVPVLSAHPDQSDAREVAYKVSDAAMRATTGPVSTSRAVYSDSSSAGQASAAITVQSVAQASGGARIVVAGKVKPSPNVSHNYTAALIDEVGRLKGQVLPGVGRVIDVDLTMTWEDQRSFAHKPSGTLSATVTTSYEVREEAA